MMLTQAQALARLRGLVAASKEPVLTEQDLIDLLERHRRALEWAATTAVEYGQVYVPSGARGNGRRYRCVQGGSTAAAEPSWPTQTQLHYSAQYIGGPLGTRRFRITDGTVIWEDDGPAYPQVWDIKGAARDAWLQKAALCADETNFDAAGQSFEREVLQKHCLAMADRYAPVFVA